MMTMPGMSQSPIDFCEDEITFVGRLPRIGFSYPRTTDVTLVNTGSPGEFDTVRAMVPAGAAHIALSGVRYDLEQFHWHTPSEHEIEGRKTPLEMHFVHRAADSSLLVLAVFIVQGHANRLIDPIFQNLPENPGYDRYVPDAPLYGLIPGRRGSFRYSGSLTTPNFDEPIAFIVFADPIACSEQQINAFRKLFDHGNCREAQPLNGREVRCDVASVFDDN